MKTRFLALLLLVVFGTHINSASAAEPVVFAESTFVRPPAVQAEVDKVFDKVSASSDNWALYDGNQGFYSEDPRCLFFGISEKMVIAEIAGRDDSKKDVYFMDVGAGKGYWAFSVMHFLKKRFSTSDKRFHIISISGGRAFDERTITEGNVTLYQFPFFKIENAKQEFIERFRDLTNSVDFMVSNYTLQHLVDPFGTVAQLYDLLTPGSGMFIANGFSFKPLAEPLCFVPTNNWNIFASSSALCLFQDRDLTCGGDRFLLIRPDARSLNLPLRYTGVTTAADIRAECNSRTICEFEVLSDSIKDPSFCTFKKESDGRIIHDNTKHKCCYYGNERSQDLFVSFYSRGLFSKHVKESA